jgi:hypothetical protein
VDKNFEIVYYACYVISIVHSEDGQRRDRNIRCKKNTKYIHLNIIRTKSVFINIFNIIYVNFNSISSKNISVHAKAVCIITDFFLGSTFFSSN